MCLGVATANSILVVSFANEQLRAGKSAHDAALAAGFTRLRPVLMTASAMIIGMVPMSLGLGEGGEQNAPLGRAVIGGLIFATAVDPDLRSGDLHPDPRAHQTRTRTRSHAVVPRRRCGRLI